jgi:hypothetical protein
MKSFIFTVLICGIAAAQSSLPSAPGKTMTWRGTLVDAGCSDRSTANLRKSAAAGPATAPDKASADPADAPDGSAAKNGAVSAQGISIDEKTAQAERGDSLKKHTQDHLTRQADPSCAINGSTSAFALLLSNGTLLNLDAGGNTKAAELIQSTPRGMAMLNGTAAGEKPTAVIKGARQGDELHVATMRLH